MTHETLAAWLRRQLLRRDWTQADLARKSGLSQGRISDWLAGKRRPNPDSCDKLADVFGVDVDTVLSLAGHRPRDPNHKNRDRDDLMAMLKRVRLTGGDMYHERVRSLRLILQGYLDTDREIRSNRQAEEASR